MTGGRHVRRRPCYAAGTAFGHAAGACLLALVVVACGSGTTRVSASRPSVPTTAAPAPPDDPSSTTAPPAPPTSAPPTTRASATTSTRPTAVSPATAAPTAASPAVPAQLAGVGPAGQAIVVTAAGYGATTATFTAWERAPSGWTQAFGPWTAHVGYSGMAPPGQKAEGDGRTPSGTFGFDFAFGVGADPGVHLSYRRVTGPSIVWDDDPASPRYNEWVDTTTGDAGARPEPMYQPGPYQYGAVIAYNSARTPGAGSAIFLHVSTGGATAGCVSLPASQLLSVLRWLDPARGPRVVLGVAR